MGQFCGHQFDLKKLNMDNFKQFETDYQGSLGNHENPLEVVSVGQQLPSLADKIMIVHDVAKIYYCAEKQGTVPQIALGKCISGITYSDTTLLASDVYPDEQILRRTQFDVNYFNGFAWQKSQILVRIGRFEIARGFGGRNSDL